MNVLAPILFASSLLPLTFELHAHSATQDPPGRPTRRGRITLPPNPTQKKQEKPKPVQDDAEAFYQDVIDLRRSKKMAEEAERQLIEELGRKYEDPAAMAVELAATSKSDLVYGLMKVVDRYGRSIHAEKLHFQLLTRPLGQATGSVVKVVVAKAADRAKSYLFDYLQAKFSPLRAAAAEMIGDHLTPDDVPRLLVISREEKADVRRRALQVLAGTDDDRARGRILEILGLDPALGPDACTAAIRQGLRIAAKLAEIVNRPARNRAFGYAAFALVSIEMDAGQPLLTTEMVPHLVRELGGDDPMLRVSSAIALGAFAYRSADWRSSARIDRLIVDRLLDLVAPEKFITSLGLLQPMARQVLLRFSGQGTATSGDELRGWWASHRSDFVGLRRSITVDASNAELAAILWQTSQHRLWFRGSKVPVEQMPQGATGYILAPEAMVHLVEELRGLGFMAESPLPRTPEPWSIDLRVENSRAMLLLDPDRGDRAHSVFADVARQEMWQRYRDPVGQPDAAAFWRMERRWIAANPGKESERLTGLILRRLPKLDAAGRKVALDDLQSVPGLPELITSEYAGSLIDVAKGIAKLTESDFRLLEIALLANDDTSWRKAIAVLEGRVTGAGDALATRLFRLLGPERVVISTRHKDGPIAVAAMHHVAASGNITAIPDLMTRVADPNPAVQRTAIYALGVLRAAQARQPLVALDAKLQAAGTKENEELRREIWGALGRIGGPEVPGILKRAMENPNLADKLAALAAMGHTQSPELASFLAARYVTDANSLDDYAQRAELALRQIGPLLAVPALRPHLQMHEGTARERLVLLLGEFQDPRVTRELIELLRNPQHEAHAARLLAEITGVDLRGVNDRVRAMFAWFSANRARGQANWFLDALTGAKVDTTLEVQHLTNGAGVAVVEELARILTTVTEPHLRVLTATMLRNTTGVDFTHGVRHAEGAAVSAIADRYRAHAAALKAAAK